MVRSSSQSELYEPRIEHTTINLYAARSVLQKPFDAEPLKSAIGLALAPSSSLVVADPERTKETKAAEELAAMIREETAREE